MNVHNGMITLLHITFLSGMYINIPLLLHIVKLYNTNKNITH